MRLKQKDIHNLRQIIQISQDHKCCLCQVDLTSKSITPCLDHDHTTGRIRGVLCRWCNRAEGKIKNLIVGAKRTLTAKEWTNHLINYWHCHEYSPREELHHTWKTPEEKRAIRNAKARKRRRSKKK